MLSPAAGEGTPQLILQLPGPRHTGAAECGGTLAEADASPRTHSRGPPLVPHTP